MYAPNGQQHIFYRGDDNGIYHVFGDTTKPSTGSPPAYLDAVRRIDALEYRVAQLSNRLDSDLLNTTS
jgi:hypothetical protein